MRLLIILLLAASNVAGLAETKLWTWDGRRGRIARVLHSVAINPAGSAFFVLGEARYVGETNGMPDFKCSYHLVGVNRPGQTILSERFPTDDDKEKVLMLRDTSSQWSVVFLNASTVAVSTTDKVILYNFNGAVAQKFKTLNHPNSMLFGPPSTFAGWLQSNGDKWQLNVAGSPSDVEINSADSLTLWQP